MFLGVQHNLESATVFGTVNIRVRILVLPLGAVAQLGQSRRLLSSWSWIRIPPAPYAQVAQWFMASVPKTDSFLGIESSNLFLSAWLPSSSLDKEAGPSSQKHGRTSRWEHICHGSITRDALASYLPQQQNSNALALYQRESERLRVRLSPVAFFLGR